jgi:hypothetical protein
MIAGDGRRQHRAPYVTAQKRSMAVETAYPTRSLSRYGLDIRCASKQMNLCRRLRSKKRQASPARENKSRTTPRFRVDGRARRPWLTRSIVESGRQPIAIGHRVDEPGPGANSPVVGMRKLEALLGFADDWGR